jgi:hypothetical protein
MDAKRYSLQVSSTISIDVVVSVSLIADEYFKGEP